MNHYEVLGVARSATPAQIRSAFRRLARAHHPDTSATGSADALVPINEAWRVLGDAELRRAYDRSLDTHDASPIADGWSPSPPFTVAPLPPSNFPWRFLLGLAAVGIGIVLLGVFTYTPSKPGPPDSVLKPGSCVVIDDSRSAVAVRCTTDHDGIVESVIGEGEQCAPPSDPYRDKLGLGMVCIRFDV